MTIWLIAYTLAALYTFRYTGGGKALTTNSHHVCWREQSHYCLNCGGDAYNHKHGVLLRCNNPIYRAHWWVFVPALLAAALWPVTVPGYFVKQFAQARGIEMTFFKEPPKIESNEAKMKRRLAESEAELLESNKRLKELGIEV